MFSNHRPVLRPHSASVAVAGNPKCPRRGQRAFSRVAVASSSPPTAAPPPPRGTTCIAAGRGDAFDVEPLVGEAEGEKVLGGGEEAGDVEQRVVRDAVAEQRARRGHRRWLQSLSPAAAGSRSGFLCTLDLYLSSSSGMYVSTVLSLILYKLRLHYNTPFALDTTRSGLWKPGGKSQFSSVRAGPYIVG